MPWIRSRGASGGQLRISFGFCYVWGGLGGRVPGLRGVCPWSCSLTPGAVAVEPPATVVGSGGGGARGHESDNSSASSEGSSSCVSSDCDARIIECPVGKGVTAGPTLRIGTEERPVGSSQGGGAWRRKRKRQAPPPTTRGRPGRRRVRAVGVPSDPEGGGQAGSQVEVEAVCSGIPPTPQRCVLRPRCAQVALGAGPPPKRRARGDEKPRQGTVQKATGLSAKFQGRHRQS